MSLSSGPLWKEQKPACPCMSITTCVKVTPTCYTSSFFSQTRLLMCLSDFTVTPFTYLKKIKTTLESLLQKIEANLINISY